MAETTWKVLEHDSIEQLEDNLWRVEGALPKNALRRVMTVAKLKDGRLVIHSAIAMQEAAMQQLEAWGRPAFLLVPNGYHRLDAPAYKRRYPELEVLCPPGSRAAVEKVVPVDRDYDAFEGDASVSLQTLPGVGGGEGAMIVRHGERATLVLNDVVFNMPHMPGVMGFVLRYVTKSSGGPRISRLARWIFIKDRKKLADALDELAAIPGLCRIIVSHHRAITEAPADFLRKAAADLRA